MKFGFTSLALLAMTMLAPHAVEGGQVFSHIFAPRRDHAQDLHNAHPNLHPNNAASSSNPDPVPHLEWNSQIGQHQSRQGGGAPSQFQPYHNFQLEQQQQHMGSSSNGAGGGPGCRSRDRVYLPDMQSFLIQVPLTYPEAIQACQACGSELVLVDGTNIDRFAEAFTSLGLYGDKKLWIKSWFGEPVRTPGTCPAVQIDPLMGNRLTPIEEDCQARFYALCY
ncbi:hypothetical protein BG005_004762 [Podila minutissima]|nr:hypothetical protein BG005_004762 [Podila minutissima]